RLPHPGGPALEVPAVPERRPAGLDAGRHRGREESRDEERSQMHARTMRESGRERKSPVQRRERRERVIRLAVRALVALSPWMLLPVTSPLGAVGAGKVRLSLLPSSIALKRPGGGAVHKKTIRGFRREPVRT